MDSAFHEALIEPEVMERCLEPGWGSQHTGDSFPNSQSFPWPLHLLLWACGGSDRGSLTSALEALRSGSHLTLGVVGIYCLGDSSKKRENESYLNILLDYNEDLGGLDQGLMRPWGLLQATPRQRAEPGPSRGHSHGLAALQLPLVTSLGEAPATAGMGGCLSLGLRRLRAWGGNRPCCFLTSQVWHYFLAPEPRSLPFTPLPSQGGTYCLLLDLQGREVAAPLCDPSDYPPRILPVFLTSKLIAS